MNKQYAIIIKHAIDVLMINTRSSAKTGWMRKLSTRRFKSCMLGVSQSAGFTNVFSLPQYNASQSVYIERLKKLYLLKNANTLG